MQNDVLATGIMSFVMHEAVYFGRSLPWMTIDRIPYFNRYKIQNVRAFGSLSGISQMLKLLVAKSTYRSRAMELRQAGLAFPFHCRTTSDLVVICSAEL